MLTTEQIFESYNTMLQEEYDRAKLLQEKINENKLLREKKIERNVKLEEMKRKIQKRRELMFEKREMDKKVVGDSRDLREEKMSILEKIANRKKIDEKYEDDGSERDINLRIGTIVESVNSKKKYEVYKESADYLYLKSLSNNKVYKIEKSNFEVEKSVQPIKEKKKSIMGSIVESVDSNRKYHVFNEDDKNYFLKELGSDKKYKIDKLNFDIV